MGRGSGGPHIHNSISHVRLGRSGDAKATRKAKGYGWMNGPTDGAKKQKISRNQLGRSSNARTTRKMPKDGQTDTVTYRVA